MNWCLFIPLLVGVFSALLGYLLGKLLNGNNDDVIMYKNRIAELELDLQTCKKNRESLENDLQSAKNILENLSNSGPSSDVNVSSFAASAATVLIPFDGAAAKAALGKKVKQDDLKIVEGIGPKIEGLFHEHDIKTWKALSETSVEYCKEVLKSGGDRYKIHNPTTWPKQAKLAYEGKWKELVKWQDELDGGKA
jgi:predicted flap endonuclease-1-like 5' DNA nuclease